MRDSHLTSSQAVMHDRDETYFSARLYLLNSNAPILYSYSKKEKRSIRGRVLLHKCQSRSVKKMFPPRFVLSRHRRHSEIPKKEASFYLLVRKT